MLRCEGTEYQPTKSDLEWLRGLLNACNDGALWMTSFGAYEIKFQPKTLELVRIFDERYRERYHDSTIEVARGLGWDIVINEGLWWASLRQDAKGGNIE